MSKIFVWGGWNGAGLNDGAVYDTDLDSWTAVSATGAPSARWVPGCAGDGYDTVYVCGGNTAVGTKKDLYKYTLSSDTWATLASMTNNHYQFHFVYLPLYGTQGGIFAWGGPAGSSTIPEIYDIATDTWSNGQNSTAISFVTRADETTTAIYRTLGTKGQVWIYGGSDGSTYNTGAIYDVGTDTWSSMTTDVQRMRHFSVWCDDAPTPVLVVGLGFSPFPTYVATGRKTPDGSTWSNITSATFGRATEAAKWMGSSVSTHFTDGAIMLYGGYNSVTTMDECWAFDPTADAWTQVASSTGIISARGRPYMSILGRKIYIWGGHGGMGGGLVPAAPYYGDGAIFDVDGGTWAGGFSTKGSWTAMSASGLTGRTYFGAVTLLGGHPPQVMVVGNTDLLTGSDFRDPYAPPAPYTWVPPVGRIKLL